MKTPKAFLSYSWDDEDHKNWVAALATRLRADGVETILDKWHVTPGDQLPHFMEREIRQNDYVIVVCTPKYRKKSNERSGGVGYEGDIMTAEVHTQGNHSKFIPVLARGEWLESAPSWLRGKYYVDLRDSPKTENHYQDLLTTILGTREPAPPVVKKNPRSENVVHTNSSSDDPVKITGVIADEVTEPRMDGTEGCALYRVPFRLSRKPTQEWQQLFIQAWNMPPRFTSMHRPGIAKVSGSKIILDGTTIEEVEKYHRETLILCVDRANEDEKKLLDRRQRELERQRQRSTEHHGSVSDVAKRLKFD